MAFSTSKFETFSARPPTPPKDPQGNDVDVDLDATLSFLDDPFGAKTHATRSTAAKALLSTPEQSPSSDIAPGTGSSSAKKRVNFELLPSTKPPNALHLHTPHRSSPLRPLPQTRVSKPLKSILKASDPSATPNPTDEGAAAHNFQTFPDMLESLVKMLAQGPRSSKLDAYINLQRTMQAYEKIPDLHALTIKMGLLAQFIRRDIYAIGISKTGPDSMLITQALKFLMVLLRLPELKPAMDDEFCSVIVDRSIQVASDATMPKTIINTHLAVLMQQSFRGKVMTPARVEKILDMLDDIQDRVSGASVHAYRIRIYRKLIMQRHEVMARHTERWFKHVLNAMLSVQKDINQSAMDAAMTAAKTPGHEALVCKAVLTILNRERTDGSTYAKFIAQQLENMLGKEVAPLVPQIWAAITVLLRGSFARDRFTAFQEWMEVFQKFFGSDNELVKLHANAAFGLLVYTVNPTQSTPDSWSAIFVQVPQHQMSRKSQWKKMDMNAATSGYLTLLYYALRPMAPHDQLERYWNKLVVDYWNPLLHLSSNSTTMAACRVVTSLLSGSRKPWNEQRALELKPMVQRDELPVLDPKWVRKSLSPIIRFIETLLEAVPWTLGAGDDEPLKAMWIALLDSLVEASSKEVMVSTEMKDAIAHIVNMLRRMWNSHTSKLAIHQPKEDRWADKFCFLIEATVKKLGALRFADKCLFRNTQDEFEVAPTPSQRARVEHRVSPLLYFIKLLVSQSEGKLSDSVRLRVVQLILEPSLSAQNSRFNKLELLRDCAAEVSPALRATVSNNFWTRIATSAKNCIQEQPVDASERASRNLGKEYDMLVDILALGPGYMLESPRGRELLAAFLDVVRREAGEGAVVLAVVEKVSERILKRLAHSDTSACMSCATILLRNLPKGIQRRTLEQGRQNLWGPSSTTVRQNSFEPYNHFYPAIVSIGSEAYHNLQYDDLEPCREFIDALATSIRDCTVSNSALYLRKIQEIVSLWIIDADKKLHKKDGEVVQLHHKIVSLWEIVAQTIHTLPRKDSDVLAALEPLISAGFLSQRRAIVNMSVTTWNKTFGQQESLQYPQRLAQALRRLQKVVEISSPGLSLSKKDNENDAPMFYESEDDNMATNQRLESPRVKESPFRVSKMSSKSARLSKSPAVSGSGRRKSSRQTPKMRLRHDDSQIQFEPIVSSPTNPFEQESQILTERQQEMVARQMPTRNLFSDAGAHSEPRLRVMPSVHSPLELHSDPMSADDFAHGPSRTPLQTLASIGPFDMYLGSSPTPHSRPRSQQVLSDATNVATPNAVRTVHLEQDAEEPGSSPPRMDNEVVSTDHRSTTSRETTNRSLELKQFDAQFSVSFDEGTTFDEEMLPDAQAFAQDANPDILGTSFTTTEADQSDLPSSSVDLQLTAQINAELNARSVSSPAKAVNPPQESNSVFVDAPSQLSQSEDGGNSVQTAIFKGDTEVGETQVPSSINVPPKTSGVGSSNTNRVGDSFSVPTVDDEGVDGQGSQLDSLRRSSRFAATSSPVASSSNRKRRQSLTDSARKRRKSKNAESQEEGHSLSQALTELAEHDNMSDCIVVASTPKEASPQKRRRGRKPRLSSQSPFIVADAQTLVLETTRKQSLRHSTSNLSQVENQTDVVVDDTPAPKRGRGRPPKKSPGKPSPRVGSQATSQIAEVKHTSHAQVAAQRSSSVAPPNLEPEPENSVAEPEAMETEPEFSPEGDEISQAAEELVTSGEPVHRQQQVLAPPETATANRSFAERVILTPRSVLARLRRVIADCSQLVLGRQEEREFDDVLFDLRVTVHAAGARGGRQGQ
ncbi:hypothetical protein P154DRAFT_463475 [Amniculicola lignicola CBS 123094]|uniref:Telomere-associated protein Rif1 N-terminal domain-containing protein n=1 Tax=Amniculicola lignicola CBS 123094 TaxID=1392246 RepID=A0A6A5WS86_9PLEO|nr:hypothetical protein P154DRAFT_463475 [Amniculicola lignicola CBS 123094]